MFTVWLTNFQIPVCEGKTFNTENEAITVGKATSFEFTVYCNNTIVGYWTMFGGYVKV